MSGEKVTARGVRFLTVGRGPKFLISSINEIAVLEDSIAVLWKAVKTAEAFLDDPDKETRFRGIHATSQAGGVYRNLLETFEFKERLEAVEEAQKDRG